MQLSTRLARKAVDRLDAGSDPEDILERRRRLLDRQIKVFGIDGGPTANSRADVAEQLEKMDRLPEARVLREEVVVAYRRNRGADDLFTVDSEEWLAANLMRSGMTADARPLLDHIVDIRLRTLGAQHEATRRAQRRLSATTPEELE